MTILSTEQKEKCHIFFVSKQHTFFSVASQTSCSCVLSQYVNYLLCTLYIGNKKREKGRKKVFSEKLTKIKSA
jgi:hypothetical protein